MFIYATLWMILCIIAWVILFKQRRYCLLTSTDYKKWLFQDWKIVTFIISTTLLSIIAPISNDPTWDVPETIILSTLTFLTAAWVVGILYRALIYNEKNWKDIYIAICILFFSSSWSYDLYVWVWQGVCPLSWSWNLAISPILYLCAWAFWNLEWRGKEGVIFAFRERQWIADIRGWQFRKVFPYMLPFIALGVVIFGGFLYINM